VQQKGGNFRIVPSLALPLGHTREAGTKEETTRRGYAEEENKMTKELVVGKDYYEIFGADETGKKQMIYNGGISWMAIDGDRKMVMDSQPTTDKAVKYINQPSYKMGR
jgi:hypothetical protein